MPESTTGQTYADTVSHRTAEERDDVERALSAAFSQSAGHWPTVAAVLADEVVRLRNEIAEVTR